MGAKEFNRRQRRLIVYLILVCHLIPDALLELEVERRMAMMVLDTTKKLLSDARSRNDTVLIKTIQEKMPSLESMLICIELEQKLLMAIAPRTDETICL